MFFLELLTIIKGKYSSRLEYSGTLVADLIVGLVLLVIGAVSLPYIWSYSEEIAFSAIRSNDELAMMRVVEQLLSPSLSYEYFKHFNTFSYGAVWWAVLAITAAPFKLLGSEQGMVISVRLLSPIFSLVGFYFAYAAVREFVTRRIDLLVGLVLLIIGCFFTQIVFINSTHIHPEVMYCAFLMMSFQQLARAQGQINRNFYWSLLWLAIAISIKLLAALFGVAYLVYWWLGPRNIGRKAVLKAALVVLIPAIILNPWVLFPGLAKKVLAHMSMQSAVTREGWPELHHTWTIANSINYFSAWYMNFIALLIVLSLALVTTGFLWGRWSEGAKHGQSTRLFFMSLASFVAYALFCLFYAWQPMHYGIVILYLLPVLVVSMLDLWPAHRKEGGSATGWRAPLFSSLAVMLVVGGLYLVQRDNLVGIYNLVTNPAGGKTQVARERAIYKIKDVLGRYPGTIDLVGVAHDLAVPVINGRQISYWHLNSLPGDMVGNSDVLIFWKPDYAYDMKYINREPTDPAAFDTYNRIREGGKFKTSFFTKFFEDDELEVYSRTEIMRIFSDSTTRRHDASRAFDGSVLPDDFWEAEGPFPHSISMSFPADQSVSRYQFSAGELAKRMPKSWQLEGSHDGQTWVVLDERLNEKPWVPGETRTYPLRALVSFPNYQFTFSEGFKTSSLRIYEIRVQ